MLDRRPIPLSSDHELALGGGRIIYAHPTRHDVVIKVFRRSRKKPLGLLRKLFRRRKARYGRMLNSFVEIEEIAASVGRTGQVPACCAQFLGFIQTDQGAGAMFEALRGADGALAPHLKAHAAAHGHEPKIEAAIVRLWDAVEAARLSVSDRALVNVVVTGSPDAGYVLTIVDGLGDRTLIPIQRMSRALYARKCRRLRAEMLAAYRALTLPPTSKDSP
ncbi:YrbL family protein [Thalassorhabdomicrobium marinisediminis]|uniref:YrbL family protein n=1 Tax=Thalassorhabdomicrobium marinisediminis TaxID=2170577 RepID=UPI002490318D|nr:YrbL family protein [Thalassorhabdomicrobium marinisediminis]